MNGTEFQFACLGDPRLAVHALSPTPAWLWRGDAPQMLWANPIGAAIFEAASPGAAADIRFTANHPAATQVARLAGTLPAGGASRLERLRGFGAAFGGALICLCSRITLADNITAILIISTERAGKELSLPDRAQRLFADFARPAAAFTADGELIAATDDARARFGQAADLSELGGAALAREAMLNGTADGELAGARVTLRKLGASQSAVALLLVFPAPAGTQRPTVANPVAAEPRARRFPLRFVWQMDAATRFTQIGRASCR